MSVNAYGYGDPNSGTGDHIGGGAGQGTVRPTSPSGPSDGPDGSQAAARLLEMTARETDQWRSEARSEAAAIVAGAREEAERLVASARDEAAQTTNEARVEAYRVREETTALRRRHDEDIARLEQVATEHRELLRHHLTEMLDRVDSDLGESNQ
jgi:cell division septum initiation protein DivIVA